MEFYTKLTDFIKSARAIKKLDLYISVERPEKEKKFKEFAVKLKSILSIQNLSEEGTNFRKYWIQIPYLSKLIETSFQYCSNAENAEIKKLLDKAKKNLIINENIHKNEQDINKKMEEKKQIKDDEKVNNKDKDKDKYKIDLRKINPDKVQSFFPKNYERKDIEEKKNEEKKDKYQYYLNESNNINFDNFNNFDNFDNDKNNILKNNIKNIKKENFDINKNENKHEINNNLKNNSKDINNDIKKNKIEDLEKLKFELNNNNKNKINKNNIIINVEEKEKEKIIDNNNIARNKEINIKPFIAKDNSNQNKPILSKQENETIKIEELCDELLSNYNRNNIIQIIFNTLLNNNKNDDKIKNINQICSKIFGFVKRVNIKNININQNLKEKLITLICILYPFSKGQKSEIKKDIFISESSSDKKLYEFLSKSIIIEPIEGFKFSEFNDNKTIENFCYDLKLDMKVGKYEIYNAFIFLIIFRNLRKYDKNEKYKEYFKNILEKEFMISYKLIFILEHVEFYAFNLKIDDYSNFCDIYNGLYFIKIFYDEIFSEIKLIHKNKDNSI